MECDVCSRVYDAKRLPFLCAVDARNQLYQARVKSLQLLLENERLQKDVSHGLADPTQPTKAALDSILAQKRLAQDRTDEILAAAAKLRDQIQAARDEAKATKSALARRRMDLASISDGLLARRARQQHEVERSTQMLRFRWSQSAHDLARTRAFLCCETIRLYGLRRTKKGSTGRYDYHIARVPVVDLASMDALSPEAISTSLAHVAHILILVSHYLAVRLPAEITLPHRDSPQPTIYNLAGSYQRGNAALARSSSTAQATDVGTHHVPRSRPLFVEKPLHQLSKEDPAMHSFLLEGVTLLAYDIAWLCSTQGVSIGDKGSFEDICNMGRNLYNLLLAAQMQGYTSLSVKAVGTRDPMQNEPVDSQTNWVGRYSHGTTYYPLGGAQGSDFVRTFKLPSPMKLADRLKKKLLGDAHAADWEVLDDDAWKVEEVVNETGEAKDESGVADGSKAGGGKAAPRAGSNGWTKVKHRVS